MQLKQFLKRDEWLSFEKKKASKVMSYAFKLYS